MPSIKEYNVKLTSLKNTRKITKTMKMVAASKLRRAQEAQRNGKTYARQLSDLISRLAASVGAAHPLLAPRPPVREALVLVFTSDKGLCAGFNNNLIKFMRRWIAQEGTAFQRTHFSFCGRRGFQFFRNRVPVMRHYEGSTARPQFSQATAIAADAIAAFLSGQVQEVYLAYNEFRSPLSQKPHIQKLLPVEPREVIHEAEAYSINYIFEPEQARLLDMLLPKSVGYKIYYALLENAAGEHGARMTAMDNATANADSLVDAYTLLRNRARQASITKELIEIVSGAEAL
jgi:F-type H+-transporting ATPase subunit gamma